MDQEARKLNLDKFRKRQVPRPSVVQCFFFSFLTHR